MCPLIFGWEEFSHTQTVSIGKGALGNQNHLLKQYCIQDVSKGISVSPNPSTGAILGNLSLVGILVLEEYFCLENSKDSGSISQLCIPSCPRTSPPRQWSFKNAFQYRCCILPISCVSGVFKMHPETMDKPSIWLDCSSWQVRSQPDAKDSVSISQSSVLYSSPMNSSWYDWQNSALGKLSVQTQLLPRSQELPLLYVGNALHEQL